MTHLNFRCGSMPTHRRTLRGRGMIWTKGTAQRRKTGLLRWHVHRIHGKNLPGAGGPWPNRPCKCQFSLFKLSCFLLAPRRFESWVQLDQACCISPNRTSAGMRKPQTRARIILRLRLRRPERTSETRLRLPRKGAKMLALLRRYPQLFERLPHFENWDAFN